MAKRATRGDKVRWGIISTAAIGVEKVIPGMLKSRQLEVRAIASRSLASARKAARKLGIPVAYGSYAELYDDPEIDAVYNPLPNPMHVPETLAAAAKGKHVLCEKPIAMNAREAAKLKSAPGNILIAEAFMVRHHPQWQRARAMVREGRLGTVTAMQSLFSYYNVDPANIRNIAAMGGGATYDIGCYPTVVARYIFGSEPVRVAALAARDPEFGTDRLTSALIDFGAGRHLTFTVGTQLTPYQRVNIVGDKGRLEVEIPFNAPLGERTTLYFDNGKKLADQSARAITLAKADQYQLQAEAFGRAIRGEERMEFGVDDAILQARVLDAIFRAARSGRWEKP